MKSDDMLLILGAAVGVFLIAQAGRVKAGTVATLTKSNGAPAGASSNAGFGNVISTWNGWVYFDSGYAKDQFGNIYFQGEQIANVQWGAV